MVVTELVVWSDSWDIVTIASLSTDGTVSFVHAVCFFVLDVLKPDQETKLLATYVANTIVLVTDLLPLEHDAVGELDRH